MIPCAIQFEGLPSGDSMGNTPSSRVKELLAEF